MKENGKAQRVELGRHIVADPKICHGQPTYKGTRIMAWIVLEQIERGMTWDEIAGEWAGQVSRPAIAETMALSHLIRKGSRIIVYSTAHGQAGVSPERCLVSAQNFGSQ
jgi:uncharacterized protein (DUF433 family)